MAFIEQLLRNVREQKPGDIYGYIDDLLERLENVFAYKIEAMKQEKEDFIAFRNGFLKSDIYNYIFRSGYQLMEQGEVAKLMSTIHQLEHGPDWTKRQIMAADKMLSEVQIKEKAKIGGIKI